jgi:gluconolactonase
MSIRTWPALLITAGMIAATAAASLADTKDEPKTRQFKVDDLKLTVPTAWKQQEPANKLRKAQFQIPAAKGDKEPVELVVYEFPGGGGGVGANIQRWIGQFQAKGRKSKVTQGMAPQGKYVVVDISGTYNMPVGPPIRRMSKPVPNARMLAVILGVTEAKKVYYIKFAGSAKTVSANAEAFRATIGADPKKEKELKLPGDEK